MAVVVPAEIDVFDAGGDPETREPPRAIAPRRRSRLGAIFLTAFGALVSLGIGLWTDRLIRDLFARSDWLGWLAVAAAAIAVISLIIILARELVALGTPRLGREDPRAARSMRSPATMPRRRGPS